MPAAWQRWTSLDRRQSLRYQTVTIDSPWWRLLHPFGRDAGLSSEASRPEAIWPSAKWWRHYYEQAGVEDQTRIAPSGFFVTRQRAAAVHDPADRSPSPKRKRPRAHARTKR